MASKTTPKRSRKGPAPSSAAAPWWVMPGAVLLIVVAGVAAYSNSFQVPFLLDDNAHIVNNQLLRQPLEKGRALLTTLRPVLMGTLALNYSLGGLEVWHYHAVNLALHILAALVLFDLVRRTLLLPVLPPHYGKAAFWLALAVALLWLVHPLQTQAVTYIIQRGEVLMGLFYLLTLYCLLRGATAQTRSKGWYLAAVVTCALGMGSKEVMVTAPLLALLYDRIFLAGAWREVLRRRWGLYAGLFATWAILTVPIQMATGSEVSGWVGGAGLKVQGLTPWEYARSQPGVILHYLRLAIWPDALCFDYGWPPAQTAQAIVLPALVLGALLVLTLWALYYRPTLGFLGAWFFLILALTSSVMPIADLAVEHRMYLSLAAVVVLVVLLGFEAWRYLFPQPQWAIPIGIAAAVVLGLGGLTYQRNQDYRTAESIWEDTAQKRPENARAHSSLVSSYYQRGDVPKALEKANLALHLNPQFADAYFQRGVILKDQSKNDQGQLELAVKDLTQAIELNPRIPFAHFHRGNALALLGKHEEAIQDHTQAIRLKPDLSRAYNHRARSYFMLKQFDLAWADMKQFRALGDIPDPEFIQSLTEASGRTED